MTLQKYVLLLLSFVSINLFSQEKFVKTGESEITEYRNTEDRIEKKINNLTFDFISIYKDNIFHDILLEQKRTFTITQGVDGFKSNIELTAYEKNKNIYSKILWKINEGADLVEKDIDHIKFILFGSASAEDAFIFYSKYNGEKYCIATSDLNYIVIPNTKNKRIVSYLCVNTFLYNQEEEEFPNLVGILNYGNPNKLQQRVLIIGNFGDLPWTPEIYILDKDNKKHANNYTHWAGNMNHSKEAISNFSILLEYYDDMQVTIPITNDEIIIDKITYNGAIFKNIIFKSKN
jgi:hypothetical protein